MISETLQLIYSEASNISPVSNSFSEPSIPRVLNFEPQKHEYITCEDKVYVKFYGPMSSGMEYFIQREDEHKKRMQELEKTFREKDLSIKGYFAES